MRVMKPAVKIIFFALLGWLGFGILSISAPAHAQGTERALPYFSSLRGVESNVRTGPGFRYPIQWIYKRAGLPVKIVDRYELWRKIEDHKGDGGWVHRNLLSPQQTVMVLAPTELREKPMAEATKRAILEADVIANLEYCEGDWCRVEVEKRTGWLPKQILWGAE